MHPEPRQLARIRRVMTSVAAKRKIPVIVKVLFFRMRNKELPSQCKWFGAIGTVVVLLSGVLPLFCGVGVRPGIFLHGESARAAKGH